MTKKEQIEEFRKEQIAKMLELLQHKAYNATELSLIVHKSREQTRCELMKLLNNGEILASSMLNNRTVYFFHADHPELMPKNSVRKDVRTVQASPMCSLPAKLALWMGYFPKELSR